MEGFFVEVEHGESIVEFDDYLGSITGQAGGRSASDEVFQEASAIKVFHLPQQDQLKRHIVGP